MPAPIQDPLGRPGRKHSLWVSAADFRKVTDANETVGQVFRRGLAATPDQVQVPEGLDESLSVVARVAVALANGARLAWGPPAQLKWAPYTEFGKPDPDAELEGTPAGSVVVRSVGYRDEDIIVYWVPADSAERETAAWRDGYETAAGLENPWSEAARSQFEALLGRPLRADLEIEMSPDNAVVTAAMGRMDRGQLMRLATLAEDVLGRDRSLPPFTAALESHLASMAESEPRLRAHLVTAHSAVESQVHQDLEAMAEVHRQLPHPHRDHARPPVVLDEDAVLHAAAVIAERRGYKMESLTLHALADRKVEEGGRVVEVVPSDGVHPAQVRPVDKAVERIRERENPPWSGGVPV